MDDAAIFVVSGVPGAGKSAAARALAARFARAIVVSGDDIRLMVVRGAVSGLDVWTPEHSAQFSLSWRCEAHLAVRYADAGFTVVIDDVLAEDDLRRCVYPVLGTRRVHRVLLRPPLEVAIARDRARTNKEFDPERLVPVITRLHATLTVDAGSWLVLDNGRLDPEQTADAILAAFAPRPLERPSPPA